MKRFPDRAKTERERMFRIEMVIRRYLAWKIFQAIKHFPFVSQDSIEAAEIAAASGVQKLHKRGYIDSDTFEGGDEEDDIRH